MEDHVQVQRRSPEKARKRRSNLLLALLAAASILVPFLFWRGTWFGRPLTDSEMQEYLTDTTRPRHIQHALVQIGERNGRGDQAVQRWYPDVLAVSDTTVPELRITLAWVLGTDNRSDAFHELLRKLLDDPEPMVRRNAALSLVRFGDASGKSELLKILRPLPVHSPAQGTLRYRVKEGVPVAWNAVVAQVEQPVGDAAGVTTDVHSPIPGTLARRVVPDAAQVNRNAELMVVAPEEESAWEALRALYLIGQPEDASDIEALLRDNGAVLSEKTKEQAADTLAEIKRRAEKKVE